MCRRVDCTRCGRPTFAGCGAHVEQVLRNVPAAERCRCREQAKTEATGAAPEVRPAPRSWLRELLGK